MSFLEQTARQLNLLAQDAASVLKVLLMSQRVRRPGGSAPAGELFILGNGPSLREAIDTFGSQLAERRLMAVNFFANTPDFEALRPQEYILADGHFFDGIHTDPNVEHLWEHIRGNDWGMILHVPLRRLEQVRTLYQGDVRTFNLTPVEGHAAVIHPLIRRGLGMPRPRNVLIAAVMVGIGEGYPRIYLLGADHSWSRTLSVDSKNRVLSRQPHFYADNEEELDRVAEEYKGYHLHDILQSLTVAFRSYHQIADYIRGRGVEIINLTPDSMIDAFPRRTLVDVLQN